MRWALGLVVGAWAVSVGESVRAADPPAPAPADAPAPAPETPKGIVTTPTPAVTTSPTNPVAVAAGPVVDAGHRPYAIQVWVVVDPRARLDERGREVLLDSWRGLVQRFVGPPWQLEVVEGPGPLIGGNLEAVSADTVAAATSGKDKGWLIRVASDEADGFVLTGREFDAETLRLGEVVRRRVAFPCDVARGLLDLSLSMFSPVAEVGDKEDGLVKVVVRGGALPAASLAGRVVAPGTTFRLIRLNYTDAARKVIARSVKTNEPLIKDVPHSFLRVETVDGPAAMCSVVSGVRDPLTKKAVRSRVVALGIKPTSVASRYWFVIPPERSKDPAIKRETAPPRPAPGYVLTFRDVPNGTPRPLGITDREGRITLPSEYSNQLVILRLQAGGSEPVVEFPAMPGESDREQMIPIQSKPEAVALQTHVNAIRDELVDLVGIRARLEARIKPRIEGERWDEARELIAQFHKLPDRKVFETRLKALTDKATLDQRELKRPILTRTAQALLADAQALVDRYLVDATVEGYEESLKEHDNPPKPGGQAAAPAPVATASAAPAVPAAGGNTPFGNPFSDAIAGSAPVDYAPPDGMFHVTMPAPTKPINLDQSFNGVATRLRIYPAQGLNKSLYLVMVSDQPVALDAAGQDAFIKGYLATLTQQGGQAQVSGNRAVSAGNLSGREMDVTFAANPKFPKGGAGRVRILFRDRTVFVLTILAGTEQLPPLIDPFFSSFRLTGF